MQGSGIDILFNPWNPQNIKYEDIIGNLKIDLKSINYKLKSKSLDHLICPICKLPFIKPWSTICGHTFCKDCIFESFKSVLGEKCPLDRVSLKVPTENNDSPNDDWNDFDIYPAPIILSNITDDLKVECLNSNRGCKWIGERWSIKNHVIDTCPFTRIICKCGKLCERWILVENGLLEKLENDTFCIPLTKKIRNDSNNETSKRNAECDDCDGILSDGDDDDEDDDNNKKYKHYDSEKKCIGFHLCPHSQMECSECDEMILMKDMKYHLSNECLKNMIKCTGCHLLFPYMYINNHELHCSKIYIDCPGMKFGCNWKGQRELLESIHKDECVFIKMSTYLNNTEKKVSNLEKENESLKLQMSSILDSVVQGKVHNLGYPLELEEINNVPTNNNSSINNNIAYQTTNEHELPGIYDLGLTSNIHKINISKVKHLIKDLEINRNMIQLLVDQNGSLHDQLNSQRSMIVNLQQQVQFMMIERRRNISETKLSTKL